MASDSDSFFIAARRKLYRVVCEEKTLLSCTELLASKFDGSTCKRGQVRTKIDH